MIENQIDIAEQFVAEVRGWLGVPFRYQGRDRRGVDCVGVVVLSLATLGFDIDVEFYGKRVTSEEAIAQLRSNGRRVSLAEMRAGDIALLDYRGESNHIGVLTGEGTMIHSLALAKKVVEQSLDHPDVKPHMMALYRLTCMESA